MLVNGCYETISLTLSLLCIFCVGNADLTKAREHRHLFPLLGYLHGYKIGQNFALQLPPFILQPLVIVPSVNQQQSVNVQKSTNGENYQEHGGTFQIISPAKLISNITESNDKENEVNRISLNQSVYAEHLKAENLNYNSENNSFRQIIIDDNDVSATDTTQIDELTSTTEVTNVELEDLKLTTKSHGPYAAPIYDDAKLNTLSITTAPVQFNLSSPQSNLTSPTSDDKWTDFSRDNQIVYDKNVAVLENISNSLTTVTPPIAKGYPYPNRWYNANKIDRLSLTTISYTNNESLLPPTYDDRWQSFSSLRKSHPTSDFRPLSGLYHDGFLHRPLIKKTGFIPYNSRYIYYN